MEFQEASILLEASTGEFQDSATDLKESSIDFQEFSVAIEESIFHIQASAVNLVETFGDSGEDKRHPSTSDSPHGHLLETRHCQQARRELTSQLFRRRRRPVSAPNPPSSESAVDGSGTSER